MAKVTINPKFSADAETLERAPGAPIELRELRVRIDPELQRDLDAAKAETGIRSDAEVVRHALRRLAKGGACVLP